MKVAVIFDNFGPYHLARLRAASQVCTLLALEIHRQSDDYPWESNGLRRDFNSVTLDDPCPSRQSASAQSQYRRLFPRLRQALADFAPDCLFIPGWSSGYSM